MLKVDKTFVDRLPVDEEGLALVQTVLDLAHAFHLVTVAEGIEDEGQRRALERLGCDRGQGYLFARPMPAAQLGGLLAGDDPVLAGASSAETSPGAQ